MLNASSFGAKLYHYQDYKNHELDAVTELEGGEWCAFEIKLGAEKIDEGAMNLIKTCADSKLPRPIEGGACDSPAVRTPSGSCLYNTMLLC